MDLSIVTTLYNSAPYLEEFCSRAAAAAAEVARELEIILVNDGSPDDSLAVALELQRRDPRIKVVDLSRNFGHHKAMMTGLAHSHGELVFLLDCDLEEEPELLLRFAEERAARGADVVYGVQERRKGGVVERLAGSLFYRLFNLLSTYPVPANQVCARLMTRRYVDSLVAHRDREVFIGGLWAATGYLQVPVAVTKHDKGRSSYTLRRKLALVIDSLTSFSNRPLVLIFYLGLLILLLSAAIGVYLVVRRLAFGDQLAGWPSLMVSVWFFGGLVVFSIGIIGIYLAKIFTETKDRPYTVVRQVYEGRPGGPTRSP